MQIAKLRSKGHCYKLGKSKAWHAAIKAGDYITFNVVHDPITDKEWPMGEVLSFD